MANPRLEQRALPWRDVDRSAFRSPGNVRASHYQRLHALLRLSGCGLQPREPRKTVELAGAAVYKNVYRFRNLQNGYYLWSADENEKAYIIGNLSQTWKYEGPAYVVNTVTNTSPLWRFRNIRGGFYLYSADPNEKNTIVATLASVWQLEGEAYKVSRDSSGRPVWRFRNKQNGTYLLSADPNEKNTIVNTLSATWQLEGPAFYLAP